MNIQLTFDPEFDQVVCRMPVEPKACEKLAAALASGILKDSQYFGFTGEPSGFFTDAFVEVEGRHVYLHATEAQDEIRLSVGARNLNGLDHTDFKPDMENAWLDFVQPLRRVLEILQ